MAGPTDVLTEDVKDLRESNRQLAAEIKGVFERLSSELRESNHRLATEMRESNLRLTEAINGVARDLAGFRVEVAKDFGEVNARLDTTVASVRILGRGVLLLFPVVISLMGAAIGIAWYAGRLESRVERVEKAIGAMEKPGAAKR